MAYRLSDHRLAPPPSATPDNLRRAFESAVGEIYRADRAAEKKLQHRIPIVAKAKILGLSQAGAEKRALSDAARALAQLWKV